MELRTGLGQDRWRRSTGARVGARMGRKSGALRWEIVSDVEKTAGFQWMGMCSTFQSRYESERVFLE